MNIWMKRTPAGTVVAVFLVGLLAGCLGDDGLDPGQGVEYVDEPVTGLVIEHEEGTADYGADRFAKDHTWRACGITGTTLGDMCREEAYPLVTSLPPVDETDPAVDLLGARIHETSREFMVTIEMAELREDWDHIGNEVYLDHRVGFTYGEGDDAREGAIGLEVANQSGVIAFFSTLSYSDECNDWLMCWYQASYEIEYGKPGLIHLSVPRSLVPSSAQGENLTVTEASVRHLSGPLLETRWSLNDDDQFDEWGYLAVPPWHNFVVDRWTGEEVFTFQTPKQVLEDEGEGLWPFTTNQGNAFDATGQYRPETDMQQVAVEETEETFTLSVQVASVQEDPGEHFLWTWFGIPDGRGIEGGFNGVDGEREIFSGYWNTSDGRWNDVPAQLDVEPGEPGWLHLSWHRSALGSPEKGDLLSFGFAMMFGNAVDVRYQHQEIGPFELEVLDRTGGFYRAETLPAYQFQLDSTEARNKSVGILVEDTTGDTAFPPMNPLDPPNQDQFDVTFVQAKGRDEATVQVLLGVADISRVEVPMGYEAVVYAVGMQTDAGDYMVFYYKTNDQQGYYCAPDTLTLTDDPEDPNVVGWSPITGVLHGAISFQVPHECLGVDDGESFQVNDLTAGTFLLEDVGGAGLLVEVHTVDHVQAASENVPFMLGLEPIPMEETVGPAWYVAPLGLEGQDWNILGVVIAVLLATGGAIAVWMKRRKLRNYLAQVDQAAGIKDLTARETALNELRTLLHTDLVAGQVSEGHYAVVMRHIDEAMKHVRVKSIEETFRELPFHIVSKLRSVLDDGVITADEHEMVTDLIDRAQIPAEDKQKVLARLQRWQLVDEVVKA